MTETIEVDWKQFCDTYEHGRFRISEPWVLNGFRYATNSRIMVMQFTGEPDTIFDEKKPPDVSKVRAIYDGVKAEYPWPVSFPNCPICGALGKVEVFECASCDGEGIEECNLGHDHDCGDCGGTGRAKGKWHRGESSFDICDDRTVCPIEIGGGRFQRYLVRMVETLPGPFVYGIVDAKAEQGAVLIVECAQGIRAIVMGIGDR